MIIVEKNPGQKIDYEVNKTKLTFDDDLTLNLAKREEDYAVHIDVCFDEDGALCIGAAAGRSYVAQIDIPPRQYKEVPATAAETTTGEAADDADGSHTPQQTTAREPLLVQVVAAVFGYTLDLGDLGNKLLAVVNAVFAVLSILGIVTDPTTAGIGDSPQAMTYEEPKQNLYN